jgi:hypothetical protein
MNAGNVTEEWSAGEAGAVGPFTDFGTTFSLRDIGESGTYHEGGSIVAYARSRPYRDMDDLGLTCAIVQEAIDQRDVERALRRASAAEAIVSPLAKSA